MHRIHVMRASTQLRLSETWDLVAKIESSVDAGEVKSHLLGFASSQGLSSLFAGWVPSPDSSSASPEVAANILHDHEPKEWSQRYLERGYINRDPSVRKLQQHQGPFTWADAYDACRSRDDVKLIDGEASTFGLRLGYVVPVALLGRLSLAFSFGGTSMNSNREVLSQLTFVTNVAAGHLISLVRCHVQHEASNLTTREIDCLSWAAEGKTDWEIAKIIGVSRVTVTKHLATVREKLDAMNKFHAVAKALRLKIIR